MGVADHGSKGFPANNSTHGPGLKQVLGVGHGALLKSGEITLEWLASQTGRSRGGGLRDGCVRCFRCGSARFVVAG